MYVYGNGMETKSYSENFNTEELLTGEKFTLFANKHRACRWGC